MSASEVVASVAELTIAVGGVAITIFGWLGAQTAKASAAEISQNTAAGLNDQLDKVMGPMNAHITGVLRIADDVRLLVQQSGRLEVVVTDVRSDVAQVKRELGL